MNHEQITRVGSVTPVISVLKSFPAVGSRDAMTQRLTRDIRHDVVQQTLASARGEDGQDMGMLQSRGELHLLLESRGTHRALASAQSRSLEVK